MARDRRDPVTARRVLHRVEDAAPVEAVEAVTRDLAEAVGATEVSLLLVDVSGRSLVRMSHLSVSEAAEESDEGGRPASRERTTTLALDEGPTLQAMQEQAVVVLPPEHDGPAGCPTDGSHWVVLAPVIERGEALGLLQLCLPEEPDSFLTTEIADVAHLLAFVLIASRRHTDVYEWGQRTSGFSLSAEIQRRLLPAAYTCESGSFTLAAWLEPATSVGGDTFDYTVARDTLHLSRPTPAGTA